MIVSLDTHFEIYNLNEAICELTEYNLINRENNIRKYNLFESVEDTNKKGIFERIKIAANKIIEKIKEFFRKLFGKKKVDSKPAATAEDVKKVKEETKKKIDEIKDPVKRGELQDKWEKSTHVRISIHNKVISTTNMKNMLSAYKEASNEALTIVSNTTAYKDKTKDEIRGIFISKIRKTSPKPISHEDAAFLIEEKLLGTKGDFEIGIVNIAFPDTEECRKILGSVEAELNLSSTAIDKMVGVVNNNENADSSTVSKIVGVYTEFVNMISKCILVAYNELTIIDNAHDKSFKHFETFMESDEPMEL
jgi:hypothetical protein